MAPRKNASFNRRDFLKNVAAGAAVVTATPAARATPSPFEGRNATAPPISAKAELRALPRTEILTAERTGSDFMVDVIKSLGKGGDFAALAKENPDFLTLTQNVDSMSGLLIFPHVGNKIMVLSC